MVTLADVLRTIPDDYLGTDLVAAGIAAVSAEHPLAATLTYPYPATSVGQRAVAAIQQASTAAGLNDVTVTVVTKIARRTVQGGVERVPGVRNIIAVSSAKGGVGKSMVATNLALALQAEGARTGLLDADIHGPSLPVLLGGGKAMVNDQEQLVPHTLHGLQALSMGHLIDADQAVIWRGPMVVRALRQLLRDAVWTDLDFLVLDLPPGTGDIQLSIAQTVPVTGAVIVTTPQALALADAVRGIRMFQKVSIPVLGHVANMASFTCTGCGATHAVFGTATADMLAAQGCRPLLELPLDPALGADGVDGTPLMAGAPDSPLAGQFRELAAKVGAALVGKDIDRGASFPKVVASTDRRGAGGTTAAG